MEEEKMFIYKITNKINGKMYIGQTIRPIQDRWKRHISDSTKLDTHFARALREYGPDNFVVEQIDTAATQEELTQKEYYWISYYDAIHQGYNETDDNCKCGGNTYKNKTDDELQIIKNKISQSKLGGNNPHATGVKFKNINTNEELHFDSQAEAMRYFNESNHQFCSRRCRREINSFYKDEWLIAYENDEYPTNWSHKSKHKKKGIQIIIIDNVTKKEYICDSIRQAAASIPNLPSRKIISAILKNEHEPDKRFDIKYYQ